MMRTVGPEPAARGRCRGCIGAFNAILILAIICIQSFDGLNFNWPKLDNVQWEPLESIWLMWRMCWTAKPFCWNDVLLLERRRMLLLNVRTSWQLTFLLKVSDFPSGNLTCISSNSWAHYLKTLPRSHLCTWSCTRKSCFIGGHEEGLRFICPWSLMDLYLHQRPKARPSISSGRTRVVGFALTPHQHRA